MKCSLVVVQGKPEGLEIPLKGTQFLIGRDKKCNLRPNSDLVSKLHCCFQKTETGLIIRDLGSTNGTFLNSMPVEEPVELQDGDLIRVGPLVFAARIVEEKPTREVNGAIDQQHALGWLLADASAPEGPLSEPSSNSTIMELHVPQFNAKGKAIRKDSPASPPDQNAGDASPTPPEHN